MSVVNVIGLGYIGLPTAAVLADNGFTVNGVDVKPSIINTVNSGAVHIIENGLEDLVKKTVKNSTLKANNMPITADVHIIAVPTPFKAEHKPDISYVIEAVKMLSGILRDNDLVILESTSPVGTTAEIATLITRYCPDLQTVNLAYSPERVIPGRVLAELINNNRVVGGIDEESTEKAVQFYKSFVKGLVLATDAKTAEMCKLVENSFRDVNIAFANELSVICEKLAIDVWELIDLANHHPRVNILQPGPGVGGHCIAVDPWFIVDAVPESSRIIKLARTINDEKPEWVINKVTEAAQQLSSPVIACLGASFKADIDDLRESPALQIIRRLQSESIGEVLTVEPHVDSIDGVNLVNLDDALKQANIILVLVDHKQFKLLDSSSINAQTVIDTRGIFK